MFDPQKRAHRLREQAISPRASGAIPALRAQIQLQPSIQRETDGSDPGPVDMGTERPCPRCRAGGWGRQDGLLPIADKLFVQFHNAFIFYEQ
jgi:hypothetical protein